MSTLCRAVGVAVTNVARTMSVGVAVTNAARTMSTTGSLAPTRLFVDSDLSERYAKYRPKLPVEHVETVVELLGRRPELWLDVGCGPGNSTQRMIGYSDKILGVDVSHTQIDVANKTIIHPSISFIQGSCEKLPADDCSVDVVTAVQAAHYFNLPVFFKEVDRVLKSGGVVGLICYPDPRIPTSTTLTAAVNHLNHSFLTPYFTASRRHFFSAKYANIALPFARHYRHELELLIPITYPGLVSLISSWSAFQNLCDERKLTPAQGVELIEKEVSEYITEGDKTAEHCLRYTSTMVSAVKD